MDDSQVDIEYIDSPYYKASGGVSVAKRTFEFPKKVQHTTFIPIFATNRI